MTGQALIVFKTDENGQRVVDLDASMISMSSAQQLLDAQRERIDAGLREVWAMNELRYEPCFEVQQ